MSSVDLEFFHSYFLRFRFLCGQDGLSVPLVRRALILHLTDLNTTSHHASRSWNASMGSTGRFGWDDSLVGEDLRIKLSRPCTCSCYYSTQRLRLWSREQSPYSDHSSSQASQGATEATPAAVGGPLQSLAPSPFMKLPLEIRIMVYKLHFLQPPDCETAAPLWDGQCSAGNSCSRTTYNGKVPVRTIFLVSRAIYEEAMPLYFQMKTFEFLHTGMYNTLGIMGPQERQHVSKIVFVYDSVKTSEDFPLLRDCPSLKELTVMIRRPLEIYTKKYTEEEDTDLMRQPGLRTLLKVRGIQTLTVVFSNQMKRWYTEEVRAAFVEALQVLRQPYPKNKRPRLAAWKLARKVEGEKTH